MICTSSFTSSPLVNLVVTVARTSESFIFFSIDLFMGFFLVELLSTVSARPAIRQCDFSWPKNLQLKINKFGFWFPRFVAFQGSPF